MDRYTNHLFRFALESAIKSNAVFLVLQVGAADADINAHKLRLDVKTSSGVSSTFSATVIKSQNDDENSKRYLIASLDPHCAQVRSSPGSKPASPRLLTSLNRYYSQILKIIQEKKVVLAFPQHKRAPACTLEQSVNMSCRGMEFAVIPNAITSAADKNIIWCTADSISLQLKEPPRLKTQEQGYPGANSGAQLRQQLPALYSVFVLGQYMRLESKRERALARVATLRKQLLQAVLGCDLQRACVLLCCITYLPRHSDHKCGGKLSY
jgi:hypothetical protein